MTENHKSLSFGRYLRAVRREKGLDLETISQETRIGIDTLNMIEQEDLSGLPSEVFVKGFLRAYARAVGADGDRAIDRYMESLSQLQKTEQSEADLNRLSNRFWARLLAAAGLLAALIAVSILAFSVFDKEDAGLKKPRPAASSNAQTGPAPEAEPAPEMRTTIEQTRSTEAETGTAPLEKAPSEEAPAGEQERAPAPLSPPEPAAVNQVLQITAVEEIWIKVVIDDEKTREVTLNPGDQLSLEAAMGYELLIGNAAGVRMTLNGEPVGIGGKTGQVKSLKLP